MAGPIAVDEAVECAKAVCHGNTHACLLVLLPVQHAAIDKQSVIKHRRSVEDLLIGTLVCF